MFVPQVSFFPSSVSWYQELFFQEIKSFFVAALLRRLGRRLHRLSIFGSEATRDFFQLLLQGGDFLLLGGVFLFLGGDFLLLGGDFLLQGGDFLLQGGVLLLLGGDFLLLGGDFLLLGGVFLLQGGVFLLLGGDSPLQLLYVLCCK